MTPNKYEIWLDPDVNDFDAIRDILKPYDAGQMRRYPVSTKPRLVRHAYTTAVVLAFMCDSQNPLYPE